MERINKHNYEEFFLDYIEGNLKDSYRNEFERFLRENPSLKDELESFEDIKLIPEDLSFTGKGKLIKDTQSKHFEISDFEYLCVGELENDLDLDELKEFKRKLAGNSKNKKTYDLIRQTKLSAPLDISYPYKKRLQRRVLPQAVRFSTSVAAAAVAVVLVISQLGDNTNKTRTSYASAVNINNNYLRPIQAVQIEEKTNNKQEALNSHNQTINQTNNSDLAFNDTEPHENDSLYKELTVSIPDIKSEALINESNNTIVLASHYPQTEINQNQWKFKKEDLWKYAETGVTVWKLISSDELEMKNKYKKDGSIDKLNLVASNFKFSRTFNRK